MMPYDIPRFRAALERMCRLHGMRQPNEQTLGDWAVVLRAFPIEVVETALDDARQKAGHYQVKATQVEECARAIHRGAQAGTNTVGLCRLCTNGWRAVRTEDGKLLTADELSEWERNRPRGPRADGQPHHRMTRCACKTRGQQAVAS